MPHPAQAGVPTPLPCRSPSGVWAQLPGAGGRHPVGRPLQPRRRLLAAMSPCLHPLPYSPWGSGPASRARPSMPSTHPRDFPPSCLAPLCPALLGGLLRTPSTAPDSVSSAQEDPSPAILEATLRPQGSEPLAFPVCVPPSPSCAPPPKQTAVTPLAPVHSAQGPPGPPQDPGRWPPAPLTPPWSLGKGLLGMARPGLRVPCVLGAPHQPTAPCASLRPGSLVRGCRAPSCLSL